MRALFGAILFLLAGAAVAAPADLVVRNVRLVDPVSGQVSGPSDIVVEKGLIARMGASGRVALPDGARRIDGKGGYAMPGLIDVHAHVGNGGAGRQDDAARTRSLQQFLRYGVTTIFVPGATGAGDAEFPALRERCRVAECPGLYGSGSIVTAPGSHPVSTIFGMPDDTPDSVIAARGVEVLRAGGDVDALVARKIAVGATAIKIVIEDGPPPWYPKPRLSDAEIARIVKAAHGRGLPVVAHISSAALTQVAVDAGVDAIMHAPIEPMPDALIAQMAKQRVWYVPTFSLYDGILTWAQGVGEADSYARKGVEPAVLESLAAPGFLKASETPEAAALAMMEAVTGNLRRVVAAGVRVALGSDVNNPFVYPGYSAHEELVWMVRSGMTPAQALAAGTAGGAAFLRAEKLGRLAVGAEADMLILRRNPLERVENSRSIVAVVSDGRVVGAVVGE